MQIYTNYITESNDSLGVHHYHSKDFALYFLSARHEGLDGGGGLEFSNQ